MKRVTIILTLMTLLMWCFSASAAEINKERNNTLSLNQALKEIMKTQGVNDNELPRSKLRGIKSLYKE
jgi:hypothetical protein